MAKNQSTKAEAQGASASGTQGTNEQEAAKKAAAKAAEETAAKAAEEAAAKAAEEAAAKAAEEAAAKAAEEQEKPDPDFQAEAEKLMNENGVKEIWRCPISECWFTKSDNAKDNGIKVGKKAEHYTL